LKEIFETYSSEYCTEVFNNERIELNLGILIKVLLSCFCRTHHVYGYVFRRLFTHWKCK